MNEYETRETHKKYIYILLTNTVEITMAMTENNSAVKFRSL